MVAPSTEDLVVLHLDGAEDVTRRTTSGIGEGLGVGAAVSARIELLSAISSLEADGLIEARQAPQRLHERTVYALTDRGRSHVETLRDRFGDREIVIERDGDRRTVSLSDARVELGETSIAGVLARARDGVVRLGDIPEDPFVGRSDELERLADRLDDLLEGSGGVVRVSGQRGIGKTELLDRVAERADDRGIERVAVTCSADVTEPYRPVRDALADHDVDGPFDRADGEFGGADSLANRRTDLFFDVRSALVDLADGDPILLTVDDLHEASPALLELVEFLATRRPETLLLVVAARPDELAAAIDESGAPLETIGGDGATDVALEPLDRDATRELIVRTLRDRSVPDSLADRLHDRTGGIPLFLVETLSSLLETGTIDPDTGVYPGEAEPLPTPDDVADVIERRLEQLDEDATTVLEHGAVVGNAIDADVLALACDRPEEAVGEYAELLVSARLWERRESLRFVSDVIRDVVLDRIGDARRATLHERIADASERLGSEDRSSAAVARHYEQAGKLERALSAYREAGDRALEVYAHEEALQHYEHALEIARDRDRSDALADVLEAIGRTHYLAGDYDEADRYLEYVRDRTDDPEVIQRSYRYQAEMAIERGDFDVSDEYSRRGIEAVDEPNRVSCRLHGHLGWTRLLRGDLDAAAERFEDQHHLAERLDDDDRLGGAFHNLGTIEYHRGEVDAAINLLERAVDANERSGAIRDAAASYNNLSMAYDRAGNVEDARAATETALEYARDVGDRSQEITYMGNLGHWYYEEGNLERARELYDRSLEAARTLGLQAAEGNLLLSSGIYHLERCDFETARDQLETALEIVTRVENARMIAATRCDLSRLDLYEDRLDGARDHARAAVDAGAGMEPEILAEARLRVGDADFVAGDSDAALEAYRASLDLVTDCSNLHYQVFARIRLALLHGDRGRIDAATDAVERARSDALEIGAPDTIARARITTARIRRLAGAHDEAATELETAADIVADVDAALLASWLRLERGLLARDRGDAAARDRLEAAREFAADRDVSLVARLAGDALEAHRSQA
jgi:tetratricopeptide (TPR) repeat protein